MILAVLADTHVRAGGSTRLTERAWEVVRGSDVVLHAGDVVDDFLLDALGAIAPVHVVRGNNDMTLAALPETLELQLDGVRVAMVHDSGVARGRETRMRRRFPNADLVVFGHSHIPWDAPGQGTQHLFNPGSATLRRRQPHKTMGRVTIADGDFATELLVVD
jgi:uncharacterized protein